MPGANWELRGYVREVGSGYILPKLPEIRAHLPSWPGGLWAINESFPSYLAIRGEMTARESAGGDCPQKIEHDRSLSR